MTKQPALKPEESGSLAALSGPQVSALCVLVGGGRKAEAANAAGVHPQRVSEWLCNPQFRSALADVRTELLKQATSEVSALVGRSLTTLRDLLDTGPPSNRFRVASYVLDRVLLMDSAAIHSPPAEIVGEIGLPQLFEAIEEARRGH